MSPRSSPHTSEPNNLIAINSLKAYRALRCGKNLDLIITDQHSYRSADPFSDPSLGELGGEEFIGMSPEPLMQVLDGGRAFDGGHPPGEVRFNDAHVANPQRSAIRVVGGIVPEIDSARSSHSIPSAWRPLRYQ